MNRHSGFGFSATASASESGPGAICLPFNPRSLFWILALAAFTLAACGNPRANPEPQPTNNQPANNVPRVPRPAEKVTLQPSFAANARFRTTRTLRVEEITETERYLTESSEITLTRVLSVDERGRMLAIQCTFEQSLTRLTRGFGSPEEAQGDLHGSTLELRRRQGGVSAEVVAGDASVGRQAFVIDGFEVALLPIDPVAEGDRWQLDAGALAGLNKFIEAMGYSIEKNRVLCALGKVTPESAEVAIDWQISGDLKGRTAVLALTGTLTFDRKQKLVREVVITGGRTGSGQQIEIRIKRRLTEGWLDLDG